jgi:hypothetical protein
MPVAPKDVPTVSSPQMAIKLFSFMDFAKVFRLGLPEKPAREAPGMMT